MSHSATHSLRGPFRSSIAGVIAVATFVSGGRLCAQRPDLYDETVLRTLELTFKQANWQALLTQNYSSKTYIQADLKVDGRVYQDIGVRYRGNSSYNAVRSLKKPFKLSLDAFVPGQELYGYSTLNLNNGFRDPGFVREVLSYHMFRRWIPASKANWVKLIVNNQNYGVYINVEQINKDMLRNWFEDESGLRYRGERGPGGTADDPALRYISSNPLDYRRGYELKSENAVNPWTNLMNTCQVLSQTPASQLHTAVPQVLDVDEAIRYLAGNNLLPAMDSYIGNVAHNFYVYEDPLHGRTSLLPWDHNATFGANSWLTIQQKQVLDPFYFTNKISRPLLGRVIVEPEWQQRYLAHMRGMIADYYNWTFVQPLVTRYQQLIAAEVQQDPIKLYPFSQFTATLTQDLQIDVNGRLQWIPGLKPMIDQRAAYLLGRADFRTTAPVLQALRQVPAAPKDRDQVTVTARVGAPAGLSMVTLYWRVLGAYAPAPMFDDGQHGDGAANDGVYGAFIPPQNLGSRVDYYVGARSAAAQGGAFAFLPATAGHQPPGYRITELSTPAPIVVNEVLADNETIDKDQNGDFDDWVELYNRTASPVNVGGYFLSDDRRNTKLWAIPSGTTIAPGGFLRVWLDNQPAQGPLHATFSLDKDGEEVYLSDAAGRVLDILAFGPQSADRSFGRMPDGTDGLFYLWTPSPLAPFTGQGNGAPVQFDVRRKGNPDGFDLRSTSVPQVGNILNLMVFGGAPRGSALVGLSVGVQPVELPGLGPLLLDARVLLPVPLSLDASGFGVLSGQVPASARGVTLYAQAAGRGLSNGLAVRVF